MLDISRKLDDKLVIDDKEYLLNLSFDNVLKMFEMLRDEDIPEYVKPHFAIRMLIGQNLKGETREEKTKSFNDALLSGLPEGTKLMEVIKIRKWKSQKGDSTEYKEEMRKLQKDYALPYEDIEEEEYEEEF